MILTEQGYACSEKIVIARQEGMRGLRQAVNANSHGKRGGGFKCINGRGFSIDQKNLLSPNRFCLANKNGLRGFFAEVIDHRFVAHQTVVSLVKDAVFGG